MQAMRGAELLLVSVAVMMSSCSAAAMDMDLAKLLSQYNHPTAEKKSATTDGNPCPNVEKPFPCKTAGTCIPMRYVCDDNIDCERDGFDEDRDMCTAANRPPFDEISNFLLSEHTWIIPNLFANQNIGRVAHALAVSQGVEDFRRRLGLSSAEVAPLKNALRAVSRGQEQQMVRLGMPSSAWNEVSYIFNKLINSGFSV